MCGIAAHYQQAPRQLPGWPGGRLLYCSRTDVWPGQPESHIVLVKPPCPKPEREPERGSEGAVCGRRASGRQHRASTAPASAARPGQPGERRASAGRALLLPCDGVAPVRSGLGLATPRPSLPCPAAWRPRGGCAVVSVSIVPWNAPCGIEDGARAAEPRLPRAPIVPCPAPPHHAFLRASLTRADTGGRRARFKYHPPPPRLVVRSSGYVCVCSRLLAPPSFVASLCISETTLGISLHQCPKGSVGTELAEQSSERRYPLHRGTAAPWICRLPFRPSLKQGSRGAL